jgi:pimeloyl-ACP methyl ester carboxylesterase/nucleoside-diphosphate-sugar epimerase
MRVLLTAATSLVGAEVLKTLLQRRHIASIQLLISPDEAVRMQVLNALESYLGPLPQTVSVVDGELELPRFGFSIAEWDRFATSFDAAIHCAQRETQDQNLELARAANLLPVESWLSLLERNPALRLHHLSTAFTAGTRHGLYTEFDLECGQDFHNAYERSKYEAELRIRESRVSDRVTVYRPSHTLGTVTGTAFNLGGAYPLLATLATASILPGDGRARIDFVSADYVGSAIASLALDGATGTFHLACGWHASLTVKNAAAIAAKALGRRKGALLLPRIASPLLRIGSRPESFILARDLLNQGPVFDTYLADRALCMIGIKRPSPESWLQSAVRAAAARSWSVPSAGQKPQAATAPRDVRPAFALNGAQFQRVGDVNVAYHVAGDGEPVVFLHGISGAQTWSGVVERIAVSRRAVIVEIPANDGPAAHAAMLRGLLSRLDIPSAHIVGGDLGGVIAQYFAVRWPHCVRSLTLSNADTHGPWPPPYASKPLMRSLRALDIASLNHLLAQLEVPTMVVWGADNAYASPSWARTLYDAIPGARRLELIPFTGLSCHEERPDLFAASLTKFFDEVA